jgi:pimeloyl-ACP methyl ester carboxylesterase
VSDGPSVYRNDPVFVRSRDGTQIAVFVGGSGPPLVLVHGTTADHTTWRTVAPLLAASHSVAALDRRGRGRSGDTPPYEIAREEEDVVAVAEWAADGRGHPVLVLGHSFGGRCALGACLRTDAIDRLIVYEGPVTRGSFGETETIAAELDSLLAARAAEDILERFMRRVVRLTDEEWSAFTASPTYPLRVAAAGTVVRELRAGIGSAAEIGRFAAVRQPVLQLVGGASDERFATAAADLAAVLPDARTVVIDGARHAAHHTHPERFAAAVSAFARS